MIHLIARIPILSSAPKTAFPESRRGLSTSTLTPKGWNKQKHLAGPMSGVENLPN
ncbi:hypothetical protein S1OALGB6SA_1357 [Olavius algarvensis spirochete endosymbiont]|nr:hypothetical protein S1OALGB6SA_1357 [Olavius algarvensis spirochete endosymbiont]